MKQTMFDLFTQEKKKLSETQMSLIKGGNVLEASSAAKNCSCGCKGPSSTTDNKSANINGGLISPGVEVCDSIFKKYSVTW